MSKKTAELLRMLPQLTSQSAKRFWNPFTLAGVVWIASFIGLGYITEPAKCRSGWISPSIGRQGACSWHGGVDRSGPRNRFFGSLAISISSGAAFIYIRRRLQSGHPNASHAIPPEEDQKKKVSDFIENQIPAEKPDIHHKKCPKCGMSMSLSNKFQVPHYQIALQCSGTTCQHVEIKPKFTRGQPTPSAPPTAS
jgi:hypothetical protein